MITDLPSLLLIIDDMKGTLEEIYASSSLVPTLINTFQMHASFLEIRDLPKLFIKTDPIPRTPPKDETDE